jgi:protease I
MASPDFSNKGIALVLVIIFSVLATAGESPVSQAIAQEAGAMKKIVMVLPENNFRDEEFFRPQEIFEKQGIEVKTASSGCEWAKGTLGARVKPDMLVSDIKIQDFDAIVFVGGQGAAQYWDDPTAHKLAQEAARSNKVIAAICIAPVTLARAGVLKGKFATVWYSEAAQIEAGGATYSATGVKRDGKIVTASGPADARKFAEEIIKALAQ